MSKALVILSGGQDSTTCLYAATKRYGADNVLTISFDYGQRHHIELVSATMIASMAGIAPDNQIMRVVRATLEGTSPLVNKSKEVEQYKDFGNLPGGLEKTFVPARNMLFLTIAANVAYCRECDVIVTGVSQEDYGGYPDCRREFIDAVEKTISLGLEKDITIWTPLIYLTKSQTVDMALGLKGCYQALAYSHTAYDGKFPPTGKDHATLLREKGFVEANVPDPLIARAVYRGLMDTPDTPNYSNEAYKEFLGKRPAFVGNSVIELGRAIEAQRMNGLI